MTTRRKKPRPPDGEWLSANDAAAKFKVTPLTIYRWVKAGRIVHKRFGRTIRVQLEERP